MSSRLGLGEIYVFAIFMVAAVVLLLSVLYMVNSVRGFISREATYAALASSSSISLIPQSPPLVNGGFIYVNASLEGNLGVFSIGSLPGYALCTVKLINGTMYYAQGSVSYDSMNGVINVHAKCPLSVKNPSNLTQLTLTLPTPLGSSIQLTFNYRPSIRVFEYPQYTSLGSNATISLYVYNNSTGWVYVNASVISGDGYVVKLGSVMIPPESSTLLVNYTLINSPTMTLSYTINNLATINKTITITLISQTTTTTSIPTYCTPGKTAFAYLGNGTSNMLKSGATSGLYWNYMIYNGTINGLVNPIYMYAINTGGLSNTNGYVLILYYDLSTLNIHISNYPIVSAVLYPTQYTINGTLFFIFIVTSNNNLIMVYKSSNVNPSSTAPNTNAATNASNLVASILGTNNKNIYMISNGSIFSNALLYYHVNLANIISGNPKYKYIGIGVYLPNYYYPNYGIAYWDYLCISSS
ncbi:hypothetical protein [Caldivirga maquilingensis]|uniref:hypothetical protein n=1 Tax=Caldivirga maquilingensis TaxID=76887 RepID=UPI000AACBAA9|nr:hypothetical protein [Caldivirga maquilingensis]